MCSALLLTVVIVLFARALLPTLVALILTSPKETMDTEQLRDFVNGALLDKLTALGGNFEIRPIGNRIYLVIDDTEYEITCQSVISPKSSWANKGA